MKKTCELCKQAARIHCESDQAILCWDCDAKVHSANFLVARHSRNLLCRVCQSPTSWSSPGSKLSPTYSSCRKCADNFDGEHEEEEKSAAEEEEMAENHVAPWSPPPESSLSGGEAAHGREAASVVKKRSRLDHDRLDHDRTAIIEDLNICTDSVTRGIATTRSKFRRSEGAAAAPEERDVDLNLTLGLSAVD
ncbi:B-box zinc finger protein 32-like [Salvia splendens]|uniref:B-box zinc finger protein 32-like n=1 Tax=Salvia splendens TaxID=180675 RepID=UPI001C25644B|nr:B-box zinc finger protein 32-like [Salvia splendens]